LGVSPLEREGAISKARALGMSRRVDFILAGCGL